MLIIRLAFIFSFPICFISFFWFFYTSVHRDLLLAQLVYASSINSFYKDYWQNNGNFPTEQNVNFPFFSEFGGMHSITLKQDGDFKAEYPDYWITNSLEEHPVIQKAKRMSPADFADRVDKNGLIFSPGIHEEFQIEGSKGYGFISYSPKARVKIITLLETEKLEIKLFPYRYLFFFYGVPFLVSYLVLFFFLFPPQEKKDLPQKNKFGI